MVSQEPKRAFSRDPRGGTGGEGSNYSNTKPAFDTGRQLKDLPSIAGEGSIRDYVLPTMEYGGGGKQDNGVDSLPKGHVSLVCNGVSGDIHLEETVADAFREIFELWKQRQKKYGPGNIAAFGEIGCVVRGFDKMARLRHTLIEDPDRGGKTYDESIEDSWKDLTNYAMMGLVCHRRQWPSA